MHTCSGIIECKEPIEVVSYKIGVCKVSSTGKDCTTTFQKIGFNGYSSVVLCKPLTGRMHQIRVHLQYLGEFKCISCGFKMRSTARLSQFIRNARWVWERNNRRPAVVVLCEAGVFGFDVFKSSSNGPIF